MKSKSLESMTHLRVKATALPEEEGLNQPTYGALAQPDAACATARPTEEETASSTPCCGVDLLLYHRSQPFSLYVYLTVLRLPLDPLHSFCRHAALPNQVQTQGENEIPQSQTPTRRSCAPLSSTLLFSSLWTSCVEIKKSTVRIIEDEHATQTDQTHLHQRQTRTMAVISGPEKPPKIVPSSDLIPSKF